MSIKTHVSRTVSSCFAALYGKYALGVLPNEWKLAEVTSIYKKWSKSDRGNYRPVSLTSVCCKVLEQLIRDNMMAHLLGNGLISNKQYGFIAGRSTSLQLLHMLDRWTEYLEHGGKIDVMWSFRDTGCELMADGLLLARRTGTHCLTI